MEVKNTNIIPSQETKAAKPKTPASIMGGILNAKSTKKLLADTLKENAGAFSASILDLYSTDSKLQQCSPEAVFREAFKAVSLKLPLNKSLGFACVVAYKNKDGIYTPQFQIEYRGLVQLALRTGAYKYINAGEVYDGELKSLDKLTGEIDIKGEATSDKIIGYFAYIETTNGFKKSAYWTKEKVLAHAERYSKSKKNGKLVGTWVDEFDKMAIKTVLRDLISKYGYMSIEMATALEAEDNASTAAEVMQESQPESESIQTEAVVEDVPEDPKEEKGGDPYPFD